MTISSKKLKERLLDICQGAGMTWKDDGYFEYSEGQGENTGKAIVAIEKRFDIGVNSRLRIPWRLKDYEHINTMVKLVDEAILFDKGKK